MAEGPRMHRPAHVWSLLIVICTYKSAATAYQQRKATTTASRYARKLTLLTMKVAAFLEYYPPARPPHHLTGQSAHGRKG